MPDARQTLRVDKWLWAARVFKTRSLATAACDGGKVDVNDEAAKPAKPLRVGDVVKVTLRQGRRRIMKVGVLSDRRGSGTAARPFRLPGAGRPTKRERRDIERLRGR